MDALLAPLHNLVQAPSPVAWLMALGVLLVLVAALEARLRAWLSWPLLLGALCWIGVLGAHLSLVDTLSVMAAPPEPASKIAPEILRFARQLSVPLELSLALLLPGLGLLLRGDLPWKRWFGGYALLCAVTLYAFDLLFHGLMADCMRMAPEGRAFWVAHSRVEVWMAWPLAGLLVLALCGLLTRVPRGQVLPVAWAGLGPPILLVVLRAADVLLLMLAKSEAALQAAG